jgi:anti-sigma factor RsiW
MAHLEFIEQISLWLDDELDPEAVATLQAHLAGCSACQESYQALRRADQLLRYAARLMVEPAPGFAGRLQSRLVRPKPRRAWQLWLGLSFLCLASLTLLSFAVVAGGLTLLSTWAAVLNPDLLYIGLGELGQGLHQLRNALELGSLLFRVIFRVMSHPFFWLSLPLSVVLAWLWYRLMKTPYSTRPALAELMI